MNQLKVNQQQTIVALFEQGWSKRRIARELGLDRLTVRRYLAAHLWSGRRISRELAIHRETVGKPSAVGFKTRPFRPPGPRAVRMQNQPFRPRSGGGRPSLWRPWQGAIEAALAAGLTAQRIYQDLVCCHGFSGRRFGRQLSRSQPEAFERIELEPGAEGQVDFGRGAWVVEPGKWRRPHLFRVVLSHSRKQLNTQRNRWVLRCFPFSITHAPWPKSTCNSWRGALSSVGRQLQSHLPFADRTPHRIVTVGKLMLSGQLLVNALDRQTRSQRRLDALLMRLAQPVRPLPPQGPERLAGCRAILNFPFPSRFAGRWVTLPYEWPKCLSNAGSSLELIHRVLVWHVPHSTQCLPQSGWFSFGPPWPHNDRPLTAMAGLGRSPILSVVRVGPHCCHPIPDFYQPVPHVVCLIV